MSCYSTLSRSVAHNYGFILRVWSVDVVYVSLSWRSRRIQSLSAAYRGGGIAAAAAATVVLVDYSSTVAKQEQLENQAGSSS